MKHYFALATVIALAFSVTSYAQRDPRDPGIYAIVGEKSVPLSYDRASFHTRMGTGGQIAEVRYRGETKYPVVVSDTFVMVIDPEQSVSFRASEPFVKNVTPDFLMIIPLYFNPDRQCCEYNYDMPFGDQDVFEIVIYGGLEFDWEQISDNSFKIKIHGLVGGEYGIALTYPGDEYYFRHGVFGFSVPKGYTEGRLTEDAPSHSVVMEAPLKTVTDDPQP